MKLHIDFPWDVYRDENLDKLDITLKMLDMEYNEMIACLEYDKDSIALKIGDNGVEVEILAKKLPFVRVITLQKFEITINSVATLKKLLEISDNHDALLTITFKDKSNSTAEIVFNDNGHDYVNVDDKAYDVKIVKAKIKEVSKRTRPAGSKTESD